eukprot:8234795-Prorocentrum_lima.AAC.1
MKDSLVKWVDPVYECTFELNKLKSIYHRRTRSTVEPGPDCIVTSGWSMDFPWSEMRACFVLPPYPAVPVHLFFPQGEDPNNMRHFG